MMKKTSLSPKRDAAADMANEVNIQKKKRISKNGILVLCAAILVLFVFARGNGLRNQVNAGTAGQTKVRVNVESALVNGVLKIDMREAYAANLKHNISEDVAGHEPICGITSGSNKKPVHLAEVKLVEETELPKEPVKKDGIDLLMQKEIVSETTGKKKEKKIEEKKTEEKKTEKKKEKEEVLLLSTKAGNNNSAGLSYKHNTKMVKQLREEDYMTLCRIVEAEATGEDVYGKILVANVVLNRVNSKQFPNTVKGVVFEKSGGHYQFSPTRDGRFWSVTVSKSTKEAVMRALNGEDYSGGALYFFARSMTSSKKAQWFDSLDFIVKYGCHEFFG